LAHRTKYLNAKCWLEAYGNYEGGTISKRKGGGIEPRWFLIVNFGTDATLDYVDSLTRRLLKYISYICK
jgi:hypothetical protein